MINATGIVNALLLVAWIYIAVMEIATGGSPDTYLPFVWPFMSPFLIFRYSWEGTPLDENLLSVFGGLLLVEQSEDI
jgi:hypothetical protein